MGYASNWNDLVTATLNELGPYNAVQQIVQNKQRYEVLSRWFKALMLGTGVAIQRQLMVGDGTSGPARHCDPTAEDVVNIPDILKKIVIQWVHAETSWGVVRQHMLMNSGPEAILDYIESQRNYSMLSLHDEMENKAWGAAPAVGNETDPWGVKYWVVQNASSGFYGGSPTGDNMIAGLLLTGLPGTQQQFNNFSGTYGAATATDLMPKLRHAHRMTGFVSPVPMKEYYSQSSMEDYRLYCNATSITGFEEIAAAQADGSLKDVAYVDGLFLTFKKNPIVWIAALDGDTNNPIYMLNHGTFKPRGLKGDNMEESENKSARSHNIMKYHVDLTYNYECNNRRGNAVVYQA